MAIKVNFEGVCYGGALSFRFDNGECFSVLSLNDGVMTVRPFLNCKIASFLKNIAACFKDSNFSGLKAIKVVDLNGVSISVTAENADPYELIQLWIDEFDKDRMKEAFANSPQVLQALQTEKFQFRDETARKYWYDSIEYKLSATVYYAEYWAKYMQYLMSKHEGVTVSQIAATAAAAVNVAGVSGAAHGYAVNLLSRVWKYGEELRKWHNKECGYEGDGAANPTLLIVLGG